MKKFFITKTLMTEKRQLILDRKYSNYLRLDNGNTITYASDQGHKEKQQDCLAIYHKDDYILLIVADGMGSLEYSEKASFIITKEIYDWFKISSNNKLKNLSKQILYDEIMTLICQINSYLPYSSGTTLNMSIIKPNETLILNIGDSRTYTIKDDKITLRTEDDTVAFKTFKPKTSEERDKLRFYNKNHILTNCIKERIIPKIAVSVINNDEYDIICNVTDGVSDILSESAIKEYCQSPNPALTLVSSSIYNKTIFANYHLDSDEYSSFIQPGKDNSTAVVYTKKHAKNN